MRAYSTGMTETALLAGPEADFTHSSVRTARNNKSVGSRTIPARDGGISSWSVQPAVSKAEKAAIVLLLLASLAGIGCSFSVLVQPEGYPSEHPTVQSQ